MIDAIQLLLSVASANITVLESGSKIVMIDSGNPGHEIGIQGCHDITFLL